jgi:hypothetical protein
VVGGERVSFPALPPPPRRGIADFAHLEHSPRRASTSGTAFRLFYKSSAGWLLLLTHLTFRLAPPRVPCCLPCPTFSISVPSGAATRKITRSPSGVGTKRPTGTLRVCEPRMGCEPKVNSYVRLLFVHPLLDIFFQLPSARTYNVNFTHAKAVSTHNLQTHCPAPYLVDRVT